MRVPDKLVEGPPPVPLPNLSVTATGGLCGTFREGLGGGGAAAFVIPWAV